MDECLDSCALDSKLIEGYRVSLQHVNSWKLKKYKIALCHGCFDPLHVGHIKHFRAAKETCDKLIVSVTPNIYVNKGEGRPFFDQQERLYCISELRMVDCCVINLWPSAVETIRTMRPDFFVKGSDYRDLNKCNPNISSEIDALQKEGGRMVYTEEVQYSSGSLLKMGCY